MAVALVPDTKTVTLTIDGKSVMVPEGSTVWEAARAVGIDIPVLCHDPKMRPVGVCRRGSAGASHARFDEPLYPPGTEPVRPETGTPHRHLGARPGSSARQHVPPPLRPSRWRACGGFANHRPGTD